MTVNIQPSLPITWDTDKKADSIPVPVVADLCLLYGTERGTFRGGKFGAYGKV